MMNEFQGVTFMAFGNSASDIFSSIAGIKHAKAELVIGQLFGRLHFNGNYFNSDF